jgi:hypothetical protein
VVVTTAAVSTKIFEYKLPKLKEGESDKYLIGAELIVLVKWLIYSAPFKP